MNDMDLAAPFEDEQTGGRDTICQDSAQLCALGGASHVFTGIRGAGIITHSASGCAWITRWVRSDNSLANYTHVIASSLVVRPS